MINTTHIEKRRVEAICAFARIRKGIDNLSKMSQDPKQAELLVQQISDELCYLERLFKSIVEFLINFNNERLIIKFVQILNKLLRKLR